MKKLGRKNYLLYMIPAFALISVFVYVPIFQNFYFSLFKMSSYSKEWTFAGIQNYKELFESDIFPIALMNNIKYAVLSIIFQVGIGTVLAIFLESKVIGRFRSLYRNMLFVPSMISVTAVGLLWYFVCNPNIGMINSVLIKFGFENWTRAWLADPKLAIYAVIAMSQWQYTGYIMVLIIVAIQKIPLELYEAAEIDGASGLQKAIRITIPNIREMLLVTCVITVVGAFKLFTEIYVTTMGGPYNMSQVLGTYLYQSAFVHDKMGYASAIAVIIFIITFVLSIAQIQIAKSGKEPKNEKKRRRLPSSVVLNILFVFLMILIIAPMIWIIINSLKTNTELFTDSLGMPEVVQWQNYKRAWDVGLSTYFLNSIFVSVVSIAVTVFLGAACAYGLVRSEFKYKNVIFIFILGGLLLSPQVALIPLFKLLGAMNLYNTYWAMIIPYISFRLPFAIFLMRSYFLSFPIELEEAAYIDGYSHFQTFMRIVLPISRPILSSAAIMTAIFVWNEFLFALVFLEDTSKMTIPIGLSNFRDALQQHWTVMLAGIVLSSLPMIILYLIMQKNFIKALSAGSLKG